MTKADIVRKAIESLSRFRRGDKVWAIVGHPDVSLGCGKPRVERVTLKRCASVQFDEKGAWVLQWSLVEDLPCIGGRFPVVSESSRSRRNGLFGSEGEAKNALAASL